MQDFPEASYGGCGCAGGAVVTLTDEGTLVDIDPGPAYNNVTKKRQQKIYSDSLGRTVKTETLNWDGAGSFGTGGSVYSATISTYNARDQVTSLKQYQGTEASGIYQESSVTYDGHGRPRTRHVPEQQADANISGSTDHTTWNYSGDDAILSVTDARGVTATFGYNARRLLTSVSYPQNLPSGVPATANVAYGYDEAGNRNFMSDTSGNVVNYNYDTLSQLTSEARQFAGLSGTYTLAYEYTVAGQVKKVTDQAPGSGTSFTYARDEVGRLLEVNSNGLGANTPVASNVQYRASGALKHRESGNGTGMNFAYNSRGLMTQYSLSGVKEPNGAPRAEGSDFQYNADGQVKFASDFYERQFSSMSFHDKSYQYDHVGRLQTALSGVQANHFLNGTTPPTLISTPPYLQTYAHDAWNNLVSRTGTYWGEENIIEPQTYDAHNHNLAWNYDADGRLLSMNEPPFNELTYVAPAHIYDAAGRHLQVSQTTSKPSPTNPNLIFTTVTTTGALYDGDGQQVKQVVSKQTNSSQTSLTTSYYLRSSVLGQVITEYNGQGGRRSSFVYAGSALLASQNNIDVNTSAGLSWRYNNPVTGDGRETDPQGKVLQAASLDPEGVDAGMADPASTNGEPTPPEGLPNAGAYVAYLPHSLGGSGFCRVNGMETGCGFATSYASSGAAEPARPTAQAIYSRSLGRYVGLAIYNGGAAANGIALFGRGSAGYLPAGSIYPYTSPTYAYGAGIGFPGWFSDLGVFPGTRNLGGMDGVDSGFLSEKAAQLYSVIRAAQEAYSLQNPKDSDDQEFAHSSRTPCPPTGEALAANPVVKGAIREASQQADKFRDEHGYWIEHGGWIYANLRTGQVATYIKPPATSPPFPKDYPYLDGSVGVYLDNPPSPPKGMQIVGKFHIHDTDDWNAEADGAAADRNKVPGLVGTPNGTIYVGGSHKRGIWNSDLPSRCR